MHLPPPPTRRTIARPHHHAIRSARSILGGALILAAGLTLLVATARLDRTAGAAPVDDAPDRAGRAQPAPGSKGLAYLPGLWRDAGIALVPAATSQPNQQGTPTPEVATSTAVPTATAAATAPANRGNPNKVDAVLLPAMNYEGQDEVCSTTVRAQLLGDVPSKLVMVTWAETGFCEPRAPGPLKVECSGLLRPGSRWDFLSAQVPQGSKSGMLFSFTARQLTEVGIDLGFDDVVADVMCETLFFGIVGDDGDYRRFRIAYKDGLDFAGISMGVAYGSPFGVEVTRSCPGLTNPGKTVTATYEGIPESATGSYDPVFGGYQQFIAGMETNAQGMQAMLYIQNAGLHCASVEIWFAEEGNCRNTKICDVFTLAAGESFVYDALDCVGPTWRGSAWLRSTEPVAVVSDLLDNDTMDSSTGVTFPMHAPDADSDVQTEQQGTLFAPLYLNDFEAWRTDLEVINMEPAMSATVKVYYMDRGGKILATEQQDICARGSAVFSLNAISPTAQSLMGSARIESQEYWSPGMLPPIPARLAGVARLTRYTSGTPTHPFALAEYNLLPARFGALEPTDGRVPVAGTGTAVVGIPQLVKRSGPGQATTILAISNMVTKPGFTDFGLFIYDQNGLLDVVCEKLNEKTTEYIDFDNWGFVNPGFMGSAIISAVRWEHDIFSPEGNLMRNVVGLGAVTLLAQRGSPPAESNGDSATAATGIAVTGHALSKLYRDLMNPNCPGLAAPGGQCPIKVLSAGSPDTPMAVKDGPVTSVIPVQTQMACVIQDVDVWLALGQTKFDLQRVSLESPAGTTVDLFGAICTGQEGVLRVIMDDEATRPIGAPDTCVPDKFERWNVQLPNGASTLRTLEGQNPNGNWRLTVTPGTNTPAGMLNFWELQFELR